MKNNCFFLLLGIWGLGFGAFTLAQTPKIDSLKNLLRSLPPFGGAGGASDTSRINILNALSVEYQNTGSYDSALNYANKALNPNLQNNQLYIVKGDKKAIGGLQEEVEGERKFTLHTVPLTDDRSLSEAETHGHRLIFYLFSDGYQDQFGGPENKKFMSKNMRQLLYENHYKPVEEQKEIFRRTIEEWIGTGEQMDDILLMGVRV